ncbi:hypothetical protein GOB02_31640, partial [Sinorhizobium meliloti]|nr:hypothetical protein [Sinorhizobium meliloti]
RLLRRRRRSHRSRQGEISAVTIGRLLENSAGDDSLSHRRRDTILLQPGDGRHYGLGLLIGVFLLHRPR